MKVIVIYYSNINYLTDEKYINIIQTRINNFIQENNFEKFYFAEKREAEIFKYFKFKNDFIIFNYTNLKDFFIQLKELIKNDFNIEEYNLDSPYIFLLDLNYILFSLGLNNKLIREAEELKLDYVYGEFFPEGITGEVINYNIIDQILSIIKEGDFFGKNFVFKIILRNITFFDIDFIEDVQDPLLMKVSLSLKDNQSKVLIDRLIEKFNNKLNFSYDEIKEFILKKPEILRTFPKMIEIELSSICNYNCVHCPIHLIKREREIFDFKKFVDEVYKENSEFFKDTIFVLGGIGEPFSHPEIFEVVNFLSENHEVIIETNGDYIKGDIFKNFKYLHKVKVILSLDAFSEDMYLKLGKKGNFKKIKTFAKYFLEKYKNNFYISFLRMVDNETELESFANEWNKYKDNIIYRKYNSYTKILPLKEVADLTPTIRFPCFHLRRGLFIRSDGNVSLCRAEFNSNVIGLNIFKVNLSEIWDKIGEVYKKHLKKDYPELCKRCNEFYIFYF